MVYNLENMELSKIILPTNFKKGMYELGKRVWEKEPSNIPKNLLKSYIY